MPHKYINGKSLYYTIDEPAQNALATVILIHGLGSSSSYFFPVIPYLVTRIRCIAVDIAGSGLSELGESEQSIGSIVEDVVSLLDVLGIKNNVTIVGHSMGGIVASRFAADNGNKVNGVVLVGPVNPSDAISSVFESRIKAVKQGKPHYPRCLAWHTSSKRNLPISIWQLTLNRWRGRAG